MKMISSSPHIHLALVVMASCPLVSSSTTHTVSLLFENDANWEQFANSSSALLVYDAASSSDALTICKEFNETLLAPGDLADVSNKLSYLQHLGQFENESQFWIRAFNSTEATSVAPFSSSVSFPNSDTCKKLPFLCSNSAPFTSQVDTNFTNSPTTTVASNGTIFTGTRDHMTFRFMGIPYASPPLGSLRFQYPERWEGSHVDATAFQPACLQFGSFANNDMGLNPWGISEDCLYLNVYTTYIPSSTSDSPEPLRPVFFWIHGGGNTGGTGDDETFDGAPLATRGDVVIVTINHRLNIFGFLGLNDSAIPGNYALADKIAALQWVQEHISDFGGDPERVTIIGQSAGGFSVVDLLKSPKAAGLFHRAISESGAAGSSFFTPEEASEAYLPVLVPFCNNTGVKLLQCLQALPAETLLNITNVATTWKTIIDGVYAIDSAVHQMSLGPSAVNSVPFLLGFMPEEGQSLLGTTIAPNDTNFAQDLATAIGSTQAEVVLESGLWTISEDFTVYNATINAYSDFLLTCPAESMISSASGSNAFPALYVYTMQHAYGLNHLDPYGLCTFPTGHIQPYYRCHAGDVYEPFHGSFTSNLNGLSLPQVFGTYYLFDLPIRIPQDVFYTALVQDLWTAFARTGNPNPDQDDLAARGPAYESTLRILRETKWVWEEYDNVTMRRASLDYPDLGILEGLPDVANGRCAVLTQ